MIKGGVYLEQAGRINAIAFDKTGTLTEGRPSVTDIIPIADVDTREGLAIAAAIEKGSGHPLAAAVVARAEQEHCQLPAAEQFRSITGRGAEALISGTIYRIGSPAWFAEFLADGLDEEVQIQIDRLRREGKTVMVLGTKTKALALIAVTDPVRDSTKQALAELEQLGIRHTVMLTGDDKTTAQAVAAQIGIRDVQANLMPEDKLEAIKQLKAKYGNVAMVGDGVNDAPALATADIGMAMGGAGTDTALETADIALMADDLSKLPYTLRLSRRALQVIRENIAFSIGLKILALLLIIPGWLTLWMAIFADMGATLIVTLNAMRLLRVRS
jgi:Cd2+/Zn2+-exporting ATPase